MANFLFSLNVVAPLFIYMALGYILRRVKVIDLPLADKLTELVFRIFLPALLFIEVVRARPEVIDTKLVVFVLGATVVIFTLLMFIVPLFEKKPERRGVIVQGIYRSNFILYGIPVTMSLAGEAAVAQVAVIAACCVALFNVLAVVALQTFVPGRNIKKILINIAQNPLVIGSLSGFILMLLGVRLPEFLDKPIGAIGSAATPLALIALGATFAFKSTKKLLVPLIFTTLGRLVIVPCVILGVAIALGFERIEICALVAFAASPTAVSSYSMARLFNNDHELAGQIVVYTALLSSVTIFLIVYILRTLGFI